ncbi:Hypothetical_protein [Hexamita inflata]|uniref:Hypothetical_protein n=1 Tax=Hexamita inflata TaxID=28002 RepID=A0AA86TV92_9EUKA|nr:Hypothetical protein HINF_LOCUS17835 [Hexamita inflata]
MHFLAHKQGKIRKNGQKPPLVKYAPPSQKPSKPSIKNRKTVVLGHLNYVNQFIIYYFSIHNYVLCKFWSFKFKSKHRLSQKMVKMNYKNRFSHASVFTFSKDPTWPSLSRLRTSFT